MDQPIVPFWCNSLKEVLISFLQMFILNDTIKNADTKLKLMKIDTSDVNQHKSCDCQVACCQLQEKCRSQRKYSLKIL